MNPEADLLERIRPHMEAARFAFVFGSFGTPVFRDDSDLDLAADFGHPLSSRERFDLSSRLAEAVGRAVDLIDLRNADPIIAMQILRTGQPFLVHDAHALAVFRMTAPSIYFDWKLCRRPVEEAMWKAAHP
ncbi:MAG TPA: nucleotidyltransferase domain-containing protein [Thermoanaerobaculia bacterium]|nr:nucleotidyltransferase domain-containing protein [Thermoanaerobaculia bacterium]